MSPSYAARKSVAVIGGGVVGLCVALALLERNFDVSVIDRQDLVPAASWGNAGRIAVELSEPLASLATLLSLPRLLSSFGGPVGLPFNAIGSWLPFGIRFAWASRPAQFRRGGRALSSLLAEAIPAWKRRLSACGTPELLKESGHYSVWERETSCRTGRQNWLSNSGSTVPKDLSSAEARALQELITVPIAGALKFCGSASIVDTGALHAALRQGVIRANGRLVDGRMAVAQAGETADLVVVAAGVESAPLLRAIGHRVPLIAERGYHIEQPDPEWPIDFPPIYFEDRSLVLTRFSSTLRMTSFTEFTTARAAPDRKKWAALERHASELGLPFKNTATRWVGSRPTLPDYLPAFGESGVRRNVFYAFGHQHLGLTLAAITGELLAATMTNESSVVDVTPFDLKRFA